LAGAAFKSSRPLLSLSCSTVLPDRHGAGATNPDFVRGDAYNNQIDSFQNPLISGVYLVAVAALTMHLFHGRWSMLQSLGALETLGNVTAKSRTAAAIAITIGAGYASIPVAVLAGFLDHAAAT
jgi:succinate dehydrogenase / fumarate reductase cytochrome b subunit